jgi:hypothetical protein
MQRLFQISNHAMFSKLKEISYLVCSRFALIYVLVVQEKVPKKFITVCRT